MEDLLVSLSNEFSVSSPLASTVTPRFKELKKRPNHQSIRRTEFLKRQAEKRYDNVQHARNLADGYFPTDMEEQMESSDSEVDEATRPKRPPRSFRNQLMMSEWLIEVPDLQEYIVAICPKGKRALLVASHGHTKLFARNGYKFHTFVSNLPGGSHKSGRQSNWKSNDFTILDVVYAAASKTCYVLDLIAWRSQCYYDSDSQFRFYWLETQFQECASELNSTERIVKFEVVPKFAWNPDQLSNIVSADKSPFEAEIDGVLFYHKDVHYIPGVCPLVGWLKPYMLPEINIEINTRFLEEVPEGYESVKDRAKPKNKPKEAEHDVKPTHKECKTNK